MTRNQIEYLKLRETQRSNQTQEELTRQRDQTTRELGFANLAEAQRHNLAGEQHNINVLGETKRHNVATEQQQVAQLQYNYAVLGETQRHNQATESAQERQLIELNRHNLATENTQQYQAETGRLSFQE